MDRVLAHFSSGGLRTTDRGTSASPPLLESDSAISHLPETHPDEEHALQRYTAKEILTTMLSTKSYLPHPSFFCEEQEREPKQIGKGQCGTALVLEERVLKIANKNKDIQLWNDCCKHKRVIEAFEQTPSDLRSDISVPCWIKWVQVSRDQFWKGLGHLFPEDTEPTYGLSSGRIPPLTAPVRQALFEYFAPRSLRATKTQFLAKPENKDCLVRLYLGRRAERAERSNSSIFKLRNFGLMVNEMEELDLDTTHFAKVMARSLAVLHWKAGTDADDVEFVLGGAPVVNMRPTAADLEMMGPESTVGRDALRDDCYQKCLGMWLLDFNQCQYFPHTKDGIEQLQKAFYFNDPYYPRPVSDDPKDVALWSVFRTTYLTASERLTDSDMPEQFINAVEREGQRRKQVRFIFD